MQNHLMSLRGLPGLLAGLLVLVLALPARGQTGDGTILAIPETFPEIDARAMVVRERGRAVVVLRADAASAETLSIALGVLREARARRPRPVTGELIPITGFVAPAELEDSERAGLQRMLARLQQQPVTDLGSLGPGRWIRYPT